MKKVILILMMSILLACNGAPPADTAETTLDDAGKSKPEIRIPTKIGEVLLQQDFAIDQFPMEIPFEGEEGVRYKFEFSADAPARVVVYDQVHLGEWKQYGAHTLSKVTTKTNDGCCKASGTYTFDVNAGESGTFYIVIDDKGIKEDAVKPTSVSITLTKMVAI